jgi:hypothetical protein
MQRIILYATPLTAVRKYVAFTIHLRRCWLLAPWRAYVTLAVAAARRPRLAAGPGCWHCWLLAAPLLLPAACLLLQGGDSVTTAA